MGWFALGIVASCILLGWAAYARTLEGRRPSGEVAKPAPLGAGFRASSPSRLTRLNDSGYRVRTDDRE